MISQQRSCSNNDEISVVCLHTESDIALSNCTDGAVRLNSTSNRGRLEICKGNVWGSVCYSRGFSINDASVACRMLGYQLLGSLSFVYFHY